MTTERKTEAQIIREQASLITEEELREIRIKALDEMWNLKKQELDMESKTFFEKTLVYVKAFSYEIYIRTFGYYFKYPEYLEHAYKWKLYRELRTHKAVIPKPDNYISKERTYPIDRTSQNTQDVDDVECKYQDEEKTCE